MLIFGIILILFIAAIIWAWLHIGFDVPCDIQNIKEVTKDFDGEAWKGYLIDVIAHPPFHNTIVFHHVPITPYMLETIKAESNLKCTMRHRMNGPGHEFLGFVITKRIL